MDIRIQASADTKQVSQQFKMLQRQVHALNAEMQAATLVPGGVNPQGYAQMQRQLRSSSQTFRDAAASSGKFYAEQIRINSATQHYTDLLAKQKLSFRDLIRHRKELSDAYREQIALQNMFVRESKSMGRGGKAAFDVIVPRELSKELNTAGNRMGWLGAQVQSASTKMINFGKNTQWAGRQLMVGFTIPVAAAGAATGVLAYQIDKELTRIKKVYDTTTVAVKGDIDSINAANRELAEVQQASMETATTAAKEYGAAATDTLKVQADLAATGLRSSALQESTNQVMRIATLGELDYTQATQTAIALQTAFKLNTQELTEAFNFMNATENATSLAIKDIAEATPRAASAMSALGVSVEQMTVMLVSMRESGVDAAEAANALKSATGSILAPSPAADEFIKQISKGKVQVMELAEASGGNLYEAMRILFQSMEGLSKLQKQQILVKMFGKYQFNRVSAMLYNLGDAFTGMQNQTHTAMGLMEKDTQSLANVADMELKRWQESASGRFKAAVETLKINAAEMGKPFLEIGTIALRAVSAALEFFNKLPDWGKHLIAFGAIAAATFGPLVMLVGLSANFIGTIVKFGTTVALLGNSFGIVTKESKVMELASKAAAAGFVSEATAVSSLREQIEMLTLAQIESNRIATGVNPLTPTGLFDAHGNPTGAARGPSPIPQQTNPFAVAMTGNMDVVSGQEKVTKLSGEEVENRKKSSKLLAGGATSMGVMAASSAAMMLFSNEIVDKLMMLTLLASIVVPAAKGIAAALAIAATAAKTSAAAAMVEAAARRESAVASAASVGMMGRMGAGVKGALAGFSAMMGPIGWITLAVGAIGAGIYFWQKHQEEIYKNQVEAQAELDNTAESWATSMGKVVTQYQKINTVGIEAANQSRFEKFLTGYREGEQKKAADIFGDLGDSEKQQQAMQIFIDLQAKSGMTAKAAADNIRALFVATGTSAITANAYAKDLLDTIGNIQETDWTAALKNQGDIFTQDLDEFLQDGRDELMNENAKKLAEMFSQAFASSDGPEEAKAMFGQIEDVALTQWDKIFQALSADDKAGKFFKEQGVDSAKELSQWFRKTKNPFGEMSDVYGAQWAQMQETAMASANEVEKEVISQISLFNGLGDDITTVWELQNNLNMSAKMLTYDQAVESAKRLAMSVQAAQMFSAKFGLSSGMTGWFSTLADGVSKSQKQLALASINAMNLANGFAQGKTVAGALNNLVNQVKEGTGGAADEANRFKNELSGIPQYLNVSVDFTGEQYTDILKTGMSSLQDSLANSASEHFDNNMQASLDSAQNAWDKRIDGQQRSQENQMDALENRFDKQRKRIEKFYDMRIDKTQEAIEAEQKADEIRQKIFEAEMTRLDRLNEAQNRNIDFNVAMNEGNLDEAAKIRNDAEAQYADWMLQDAASAGQSKSQRRQDKLQDKSDRLGERKDAALEALQEREDAERKHLERLQQMRADAMKQQEAADMAARKTAWEEDKETLDERLELFKSWTGRSVEDLERWMKVVGLSYDDFGDDVKDKGQSWSEYFREQLKTQVRKAGVEVANDNMWEQMGAAESKKVLKGMGFVDMNAFKQFILTGKIPPNFGSTKGGGGKKGGKHDNTPTGGHLPEGVQPHHTGGLAGARGSRKGVARTSPILPSEQLVLAKKKEMIMSEDATKRNFGLLTSLNAGMPGSDPSIMGGSTGPGVAGLVGGIMSKMFATGIGKAMNNAFSTKMKQVRAAMNYGGTLSGIAPGQYGDIAFDGEQLRYAKIIADVGKNIGMSTRDIEIGIMTAITESGLRNVQYGDRDSLGLFQQRPSQGWGTPAQVTDPVYAATKFFNTLKGVTNRGNMSPWLAAQAVQRSAFSDGSNYRQYWNEATAIIEAMAKTGNSAGGAFGPFVQGPGGTHRPVNSGTPGSIHDEYTGYPAVDIGVPVGTPAYAVADGTISRSYDLVGNEPRNGVQNGYYSYGRVMYLKTNAGPEVLYAHLSSRGLSAGAHVKGGSVIAKTGSTGHSTGPHLHFGARGASPLAYFKNGGFSLTDGLAYLHKEEMVADKPMTEDIRQGVKNFANGGGNSYTFHVHPSEGMDERAFAEYTVKFIKKQEDRKPGGRKN